METARPSWRTIHCNIGPLRLACDTAGAGELVVFLHGLGGHRGNWHRQLRFFSDGYQAVSWDARGYGLSDDPPGRLDFSDFAEDLDRLIGFFGAPRAHVVGLSMGGMIALDFCHRYPARVASLVLAGAGSGFGHLDAAAKEDFLAKRLAPLEAGRTPADMAPAIVDVLMGPHAGPEVRAELEQCVGAVRPAPYKLALRAFVGTDFRACLAGISAPTLILVGSEDRILPVPFSRELADAIRGSEMHVIPGSGHLCNIEAPDEFNRITRNFLDRHSPVGRG